jgi:selenium metabolism protein YedF
MKVKKVNALGDQCPVPVVKAKNALKELAGGGIVEVEVDNIISVQNLTKMANQKKLKCKSEKIDETHYVVTMTVEGGLTEENPQEDKPVCDTSSISSNTVVVFSSNKMGTGSDELGAVLMKGFIYALVGLDTLPKTLLFYNSGVFLSTEGSDTIDDLKSLETQGVEILSCGTCLNFNHLTEKLAVGGITNMYVIAEKLSAAARIIKP